MRLLVVPGARHIKCVPILSVLALLAACGGGSNSIIGTWKVTSVQGSNTSGTTSTVGDTFDFKSNGKLVETQTNGQFQTVNYNLLPHGKLAVTFQGSGITGSYTVSGDHLTLSGQGETDHLIRVG